MSDLAAPAGSDKVRRIPTARGKGRPMPHAARNIFGRFAFVGMIMLALTVVMLAAPAQAAICPPDGEATTVTVSIAPDPCAAEDCGDCAIACAHGCCHAPVMGVPVAGPLPHEPHGFRSSAGWTDAPETPLGERAGLLRPPRA